MSGLSPVDGNRGGKVGLGEVDGGVEEGGGSVGVVTVESTHVVEVVESVGGMDVVDGGSEVVRGTDEVVEGTLEVVEVVVGLEVGGVEGGVVGGDVDVVVVSVVGGDVVDVVTSVVVVVDVVGGSVVVVDVVVS